MMAGSPLDPASLGTCAQREAVREVLALYCHAIDRCAWDLLPACFHADATYRFASISGSWADFVDAARANIQPLRISHHQLGQSLMRFNGSHASAETYFTAYHRIPADAPVDAPFGGKGYEYDSVVGGRYVDTLQCRDGVWRIQHRTGLFDWRQDNPASDPGIFDLPADWRGVQGEADPARLLLARWLV